MATITGTNGNSDRLSAVVNATNNPSDPVGPGSSISIDDDSGYRANIFTVGGEKHEAYGIEELFINLGPSDSTLTLVINKNPAPDAKTLSSKAAMATTSYSFSVVWGHVDSPPRWRGIDDRR